MTDIKPRIVDGEPICSGDLCEHFRGGGECNFVLSESWALHPDDPCIPALRQQRDEAMRQFCNWYDQPVSPFMLSRDENGFYSIERPTYKKMTSREIAEKFYGPAVAARLFPEEVEK